MPPLEITVNKSFRRTLSNEGPSTDHYGVPMLGVRLLMLGGDLLMYENSNETTIDRFCCHQ